MIYIDLINATVNIREENKMNKQTIEEWTKSVEKTSTEFEQINTELKRKYIIWNIEVLIH